MEEQKMHKRKKKAFKIAIISVFILATGGTIVHFAFFSKSNASSTTTFREVSAQSGNISTSVSGNGSVSDSSQITISASNAGTVDTLSVKQGDTIKAGQVIAHVNSTSSSQTVEQMQNQLTSAQNDLSQTEQQLDSLNIKSPMDGKVKSITGGVGDSLSTIKPLGNLAVISTSRSMSISFNSSQILKAGQLVTVTVSGSNYDGTVSSDSQNGQYGQNTGASGSSTVTIDSDDPVVGDTAVITLNGNTIGSGKIQLVNSVAIPNSGSGTIEKVCVSENQMVSKNQTLFQLSSDSVQQQISAKMNSVTSAQQNLDNANQSAAKDTLTSPIDGVVAELNVKDGDSVSNGTAVAVIMNPNALQTVISVDELDISKITVGQKATISLDAVTGKTFSGSVTQIDPIGTSSNGVATYNVTVIIDDPQNIMVGMTTNVDIVTASKDNVIVVSANTILMKNGTKGYVLPASDLFDSNGKSITLTNTNTSELIQKYGKEVTIGMATQDKDEITSGVSAGDNLAIPVTVNPSQISSLSNQSTSNNNSFNFSGIGGSGGNTRKSNGGTGNTVPQSGSNSTSSTSGSNTSGTSNYGTNSNSNTKGNSGSTSRTGNN